MNKYLSDKINRIDEYLPNTEKYKIKLDANESPYQLSEKLIKEISDKIAKTEFSRYPDPYASELVEAASGVYGVPCENIVCGNGSDELISILANSFLSKGDRAVVLSPDFSMYRFYGEIIEADLADYVKDDIFDIDFDKLNELVHLKKAKAVILSNPCNPTSKCYSRDTILDFVKKCGCLCVIDEAYMEFSDMPASLIDTDIINSNPNLIILKTLSKMGLAAVRVGFAVSCREIINGIKKVKSPYNVNSLSQAAACAALKNFDEFQQNFDRIKADTAELYRKIEPLGIKGGFKTIKPDTNFVTLYFENADKAEYIYKNLLCRSICIRKMMGQILRITCGTKDENDIFLNEFINLI